MSAPIPLGRRLLYSGVLFGLFLLLLEVGLSLYPKVAVHLRNETLVVGDARLLITAFGDSVTYGYGVQQGEDWPRQLQGRLGFMDPPPALASMARPGAGLATVVELGIPRLKPAEPDLRSVVLLMVGHNDFLTWPETGVNPFSADMNAYENNPTPRAAEDSRPRLVRVASWAWNLAFSTPPEVQVERASLQWYTGELRAFHKAVQESGGHDYVLTYLVPGEPGPGLDPAKAEVIRTTRAAQLICNEAIRQSAAAVGMSLIDLERLVNVPSTWTPDWFTDHIHPSPLGHAAIAEVVHRTLADAGDLPAGP